jgi:hypothetical protein
MLAIFPHGLESNLLVPVLLGVLVTFALNEAFGWDFVGVVVPGYLSAVTLVEPVVAVIVLLEAVLACALARLVDAGATRAGIWYPVFGRDRFYFILVVSLFARLIVEGAAPALLGWGARAWPRLADFRGETFGIGLVLVPLTANRLWRAGVRSGLFQLGVETGAVRLLLAGLVLVTNYSLSGFELGFDRLALAFLSSPLTQLTVLITAAIASDFNRRFGWDSHGILVPALIALVVASPVKLGATLAEAAAIVAAMTILVRVRWFRHLNLEGARRVVACFAIGFALKTAIAVVVGRSAPGTRVTDLFGFGYLLPSLLAERVLSRGNLPLILLPTAQTAVIGMPLAMAVGVVIAWLSPHPPPKEARQARTTYASLTQAVAAHGAVFRGRVTGEVAALSSRLSRGDANADTGDGYVVVSDVGVRGLVAVPAGWPGRATEVVVVEPDDEARVEAATREAVRRGAGLVVASSGDARRAAVAAFVGRGASVHEAEETAPVPPARVGTLDRPLRETLAADARVPLLEAPPPREALEEAAFRIARDRADAAVLARTLEPLGLAVARAPEGTLRLAGLGWPSIVLEADARIDGEAAVVVAPHVDEVGTDGVALLVRSRLGADAIVARRTGLALAASTLGVALARAGREPLLVIRGTTFAAGAGDLLLLTEPTPKGTWPAWLGRAVDTFVPRLVAARVTAEERARLRAFPSGTEKVSGTALLWLGPRARRALAGDVEALAREDFLALAEARGVAVVHEKVEAWLAAFHEGPDAESVAQAERAARTSDPAMLTPRLGLARAALVVDDERGLVGVGVSTERGRALALGGDRWEERVFVRTDAEVARALARGARTVVAGAAP